MTIRILYFAALRDALGRDNEVLETVPAGVANVGALRAHLAARGGVWSALDEGRNVRAARNQNMVKADAPVVAGDEIAFFPPVTGG